MLGADVEWQDRVHFFAVCARVMRRILVDHARTTQRQKRGGSNAKVSLDEAVVVGPEPDKRLLELDEALDDLAGLDRRKAELIELVYFGGMTQPEAAAALSVSQATVQRDLRLAKAWIYRALSNRRSSADSASIG